MGMGEVTWGWAVFRIGALRMMIGRPHATEGEAEDEAREWADNTSGYVDTEGKTCPYYYEVAKVFYNTKPAEF